MLSYPDLPHPPEVDEKYHALNIPNIARVVYWMRFFQIIRETPGDIVECGIGRGRSLMILCALNTLFAGMGGGERMIFAYDGFAGFPDPMPEDNSKRAPRKGEWSESPSGRYRYTPEFLKLILQSAGYVSDSQLLHVVPGFFADTLPHHPERPIALLHVDVDLYQSHLDVLNNLYERVSPGGLIVFDDVYPNAPLDSVPFPGAGKAVRDYLEERADQLQISMLGNGYLIC